MTSRIVANGGSTAKRALMQPALPLLSVTQPAGRAGNLTREVLKETIKTASNGIDKSEDLGESESGGTPTLTDTAAVQDLLNADGSRRSFLLPRSASMSNLGSIRSAAGSRASDRPMASHRAVQSVSIEDPFVETPDRSQTIYSKTAMMPTQPDRLQAIQAIKTPEQDLSPRQDRLGQEVTPANAQGVHTPAACVFMANLSSQRTLDQLEFSVAEAMRIYGKCYIKVQFDKNRMPYAFVQFEVEEEARLCITNARSLVIDGRPIRVEHARAHRAVYLTKLTGGPVGNDEARDVLGQFGAIEETCPTTVADQEMHGLPEGCWVKFRYFMDCKDAVMSFRHHDYYRLIVQSLNEPGRRETSASPSLSRGAHRGSRHGPETKAIFVGGLPPAITEEQLRQAFTSYGNILDCKIVCKPQGGDQMNIFAFIEFRTATEAQAAQNARLAIGGVPLRIEPKRYTMRRAVRQYQNQSPITFTSPNYQSPTYHNRHSRVLYDHGYPPIYNNGTAISYTNNHSPHVLAMRGGPPPHYGNTSNMSPYTQYPSPHYTSPLGPRGPGDYDMTSSSPMYHSGGGSGGRGAQAPAYFGSYVVGPPTYNIIGGPMPAMHPIAEQDGEAGGGKVGVF